MGRFAFERVPAIMLKGKRDQVELWVAPAKALVSSSVRSAASAGRRLSRRRRSATGLRRFWRVMMDANVTGSSAMVAYNLLLGVVPVALLALFVGGQVLSSHAVQQSVLRDLRGIFPGADAHTLDSLLDQIQSSTASTGVLALLTSLWLGSSFRGALDTAFARIYRCTSRSWLEQKRFALGMLIVVLLFMIATVAVRWTAVWPGALGATLAIGVVDFVFPLYLTGISTIVFILIMLGWFYVVALVILSGAIVNAMRLGVEARRS